jgi:hypothetical protein
MFLKITLQYFRFLLTFSILFLCVEVVCLMLHHFNSCWTFVIMWFVDECCDMQQKTCCVVRHIEKIFVWFKHFLSFLLWKNCHSVILFATNLWNFIISSQYVLLILSISSDQQNVCPYFIQD